MIIVKPSNWKDLPHIVNLKSEVALNEPISVLCYNLSAVLQLLSAYIPCTQQDTAHLSVYSGSLGFLNVKMGGKVLYSNVRGPCLGGGWRGLSLKCCAISIFSSILIMLAISHSHNPPAHWLPNRALDFEIQVWILDEIISSINLSLICILAMHQFSKIKASIKNKFRLKIKQLRISNYPVQLNDIRSEGLFIRSNCHFVFLRR